MADALSTAGITLNYAVETVAGTRPTSGYTKIPQVKSLPDQNQEPSTHQTTPLEARRYHTYIPALQDPGGAMSHLANLNNEFFDAWEEMCDAYDTAASAGMSMWMMVDIPGLSKNWYYPAIPTRIAFGGAEVDSVLEINGYLTPSGEALWAEKPADATP